MKILTKDGVEIIEGHIYYKVDFNIYALSRMIADRKWLVDWINFALKVNPNRTWWTYGNVFSTLEGAYVALSVRTEDRYRRDIEMIDQQFTRLKEESR